MPLRSNYFADTFTQRGTTMKLVEARLYMQQSHGRASLFEMFFLKHVYSERHVHQASGGMILY